MTDKQQPDAFCWATELAMVRDPVTLTVKEAREVSDEMQRMHAELERLALYKSLADEYGLSIFPDIAEMTAELETLRAKIKTYEDLGDAGSDVQLLRMGYAAARLEIESLKAQLHAAKQINAAQFGLLAASIPGSALHASHGQAPAGAGLPDDVACRAAWAKRAAKYHGWPNDAVPPMRDGQFECGWHETEYQLFLDGVHHGRA